MISNPNYYLIRQDRSITNPVTGLSKTGGGIVVYLKKGIIYEIVDKECVCTNDIELCVVKLTVNGNKKQVLLVVYRPPNGNVANAVNTISSCAEKFSDKYNNTEYVIMGDLNINYLDKRCSQVKLLKSLEKQFGLLQVINEPTRVTLQKDTLIDLCLTNMKNISCSGAIHYFLSDHFPIFVIKKKQKIENKSCTFTGRSYANYSVEALEKQLRSLNWNDLCHEDNPNYLWDIIVTKLTKIADLLCPVTTFHITKQRPVYFTSELIEYIKERDTVLRLAAQKKRSRFMEKRVGS